MIKLGMYLPAGLVERIQPHLDLGFLEPNPSPAYIEYYREFKGITLLDNGLIEFKRVIGLDELRKYRDEIQPGYVVAPDQLGNWQYNLMIARLLKKDGWSTGVVLGAYEAADWAEQARQAQLVGLEPILLPYRLNRVPVKGNWIHLLGYRKPEEYRSFEAVANDVSIDTVEPISSAYNEWSYSEKGMASFPRPVNFDELDNKRLSVDLAVENVLWFKEYINR